MPSSRTLSTMAQAQRIARAGPSKVGEEAVAGRIDLTAAEPDQLSADDCVVALEQLAPGAVAELERLAGRIDDVGEQHCREHAVGLRLLPAPGRPHVGQKPPRSRG